MKKDFRNIVVINFGHNHPHQIDEDSLAVNHNFTDSKWFDYVVSDNIIDSLRNILDRQNIDKSTLKKIVYDDVINDRNVVYSSSSQESALKKASELAENSLLLEIT